jgi:hypothetical protein
LRQAGGNNLTTPYLSLAGDSIREDAESSVDKHASGAVREPRLAVKSPGILGNGREGDDASVVEMQSQHS